MEIIEGLMVPMLEANTYVALDTEWYGMVTSRMHRPTTGHFACLSVCFEPGRVYLYRDPDIVWRVLEKIEDCVWVFHNAKFDLTHLRRLADIPPRKKVVDTMMLERILWNGYYNTFSLDALSRRYLHEHLDKSLQTKWQTATEMTPEMIQYSAADADSLLRIWREQKKHLTKRDMQVYQEIDLPCMWAVMDFRGFALDRQGWDDLATDNKLFAQQLEEKLDFNPRSSQQVVKALSGRGFKNLPDSKQETLAKFVKKYPNTRAAEEASVILDCREHSMFASRYGKRWLADYLELFPDGSWGFIADYFIIGAETGRMSASDPPLHQVPSRDTKVFREKFIARPGCKLVIGDWSQQEVAIMGYVTGDKKLIGICNSGQDVYIRMAKVMYNKDIEKHDPLRPRMKSVVLGMDYGMSEYGLAAREGISVREAAEIIFQFRDTFPGVAAYMDRMQREKTAVYTVAGRKYHLNPYSSQCYRNALNAPIQGTAADMMKKTIARLHQDWMWDCEFGVVNVVHDEVILDVPEQYAEAVREFVKTCMEEVANEMCPGMKFRADVVVGNTWADKG